MYISKKNAIYFALLVTIVLGGGNIIFISRSHAAGQRQDLQFSSHEGRLKFFDPKTEKIYSYESSLRDFQHVYLLNQLGKKF